MCNYFLGRDNWQSFSAKNKGVPKIGNNVILFHGCKVLDNITIGNNVVIGANVVVTTDIPANSVIAGFPAKVISNKVGPFFSNKYFSYIH